MNKISDLVIAVGGKGERLYPLTKQTPKPLLKINNIPLVERIIDYAYEYGFTNLIFLTGYKNEQFVDYINNNLNRWPDLNINIVNSGTNGIVHSLLKIKDTLKKDFIYSDGNIVFEKNPFLYFDCQNKFKDITILCSKYNMAKTHLQIDLNTHKNKIENIKQGLNNDVGQYCSMGVFYISLKYLEFLSKNTELDDIDYVTENFFTIGKVNFEIYNSKWVGIHTKEDLIIASNILKGIDIN